MSRDPGHLFFPVFFFLVRHHSVIAANETLPSISDATSNMVVTKRVSYKKVKTELARACLPPCVISPVISGRVAISDHDWLLLACCRGKSRGYSSGSARLISRSGRSYFKHARRRFIFAVESKLAASGRIRRRLAISRLSPVISGSPSFVGDVRAAASNRPQLAANEDTLSFATQHETDSGSCTDFLPNIDLFEMRDA